MTEMTGGVNNTPWQSGPCACPTLPHTDEPIESGLLFALTNNFLWYLNSDNFLQMWEGVEVYIDAQLPYERFYYS